MALVLSSAKYSWGEDDRVAVDRLWDRLLHFPKDVAGFLYTSLAPDTFPLSPVAAVQDLPENAKSGPVAARLSTVSSSSDLVPTEDHRPTEHARTAPSSSTTPRDRTTLTSDHDSKTQERGKTFFVPLPGADLVTEVRFSPNDQYVAYVQAGKLFVRSRADLVDSWEQEEQGGAALVEDHVALKWYREEHYSILAVFWIPSAKTRWCGEEVEVGSALGRGRSLRTKETAARSTKEAAAESGWGEDEVHSGGVWLERKAAAGAGGTSPAAGAGAASRPAEPSEKEKPAEPMELVVVSTAGIEILKVGGTIKSARSFQTLARQVWVEYQVGLTPARQVWVEYQVQNRCGWSTR